MEQGGKGNKRLVHDVTARIRPDSNQYFGERCTISDKMSGGDDLQYNYSQDSVMFYFDEYQLTLGRQENVALFRIVCIEHVITNDNKTELWVVVFFFCEIKATFEMKNSSRWV